MPNEQWCMTRPRTPPRGTPRFRPVPLTALGARAPARMAAAPLPFARPSPGGTVALQLEQAQRGELVGDEDVEEPAAQRAEDGLRLVQAARHPDHLGNLRQVGKLDADPAVVNGQPDHPAGGVEELAEDVADHAVVAEQ